jgi:hypothetical protein
VPGTAAGRAARDARKAEEAARLSAKASTAVKRAEKAARAAAKTNEATRRKVAKSVTASRSAVTGRFVTATTASRSPRTTVTESTRGRVGGGAVRTRSANTGRYPAPPTAPGRPTPTAGSRGSKRFAVVVTEHQPGLSGVTQAELDRVLAEVRLVWAGNAAMTWMTSANARLEGNRPLDVLAVHGPEPVLQALEAGAWGGAF